MAPPSYADSVFFDRVPQAQPEIVPEYTPAGPAEGLPAPDTENLRKKHTGTRAPPLRARSPSPTGSP